jgi:hypothetical protein
MRRNKDGETPIFTTVDNDAIPLFIEHGADLSIRNNKCKTVMETAKEKGPFDKDLAARQLLRTILERDDNPTNYQSALRPLYRLNFSSQVITGIASHKAWAMI